MCYCSGRALRVIRAVIRLTIYRTLQVLTFVFKNLIKSPFLTPLGFVLSKFHGLAIGLEKVMDGENFFSCCKIFENFQKCWKTQGKWSFFEFEVGNAKSKLRWIQMKVSECTAQLSESSRAVSWLTVYRTLQVCSFRMRYLACPGKFSGKSCGQI